MRLRWCLIPGFTVLSLLILCFRDSTVVDQFLHVSQPIPLPWHSELSFRNQTANHSDVAAPAREAVPPFSLSRNAEFPLNDRRRNSGQNRSFSILSSVQQNHLVRIPILQHSSLSRTPIPATVSQNVTVHTPIPSPTPREEGGRSLVPSNVQQSLTGDGEACTARKTPKFENSPPTVLASYPGSGNTLVRIMIESATAVLTGSVYSDPTMFKARGYPFKGEMTMQRVIAVKTHGPWMNHKILPNYRSAVLILRNPRAALPSLCNYYWGVSQHNTHGPQAPKTNWERWRGANFANELRQWERELTYWAKQRHAHVVIYEDLTDPTRGPPVLHELAAYLRHPISLRQAKCVWGDVVLERSKGIHRTKSYTPGYTPAQECQISKTLARLAGSFSSHKTVGSALRSWQGTCPTTA